jgi:hypothetical protein
VDVGSDGPRALDEEGNRVIFRQWRKIEFVLALDPKRFPARDEQAQLRCGSYQLPEWPHCGRKQVLRVVAHDVCATLADARRDRRDVGRGCPEQPGDRRQDEFGLAQRGKRDEDRASVGILGQQAGELDREAGLAGAAGAEDREHTGIALVHERDRVEELPLAPDEAGGRSWKVDASGRAERWERSVAELPETRHGFEVLQPMEPEVAKRASIEQGGRRGETTI